MDKVVDQAANGLEVIEKAYDKNPDIILMDINMPVLNGMKLQKIKTNDCSSKIIMLTIHNEVEYLFETVEIGVDGYILKDSESEVLINAIRSVSMVSLIFNLIWLHS